MSQLIDAIKRHTPIDEIRQLITDSNLNEKEEITQENPLGKTPLIYAVEEGLQDVADLLIGSGAEIDKTDEVGNTSLLHAILNNRLEMVKFLLEKGANKDKAREADGATPLIFAVSCRHTDIARHLIAIGCDINKCDNNKNSPLMFASQECNLDIIKILIENNCIINSQNNNGLTALMYAGWNKSDSDSPDDVVEIARLILEHSPPEDNCINIRNKSNTNALSCVLDRGINIPFIKMLIDKGGNVNIQDLEVGMSPLHQAICRGNEEMINILIENGADIEAKDIDGFSALHFFVRSDHIEDKEKIETNKNIILTLIKNGAVVNFEINRYYHEKCPNKEIVQFIDRLSKNLTYQVSLIKSNIQAKLNQILSVIGNCNSSELEKEYLKIKNIQRTVKSICSRPILDIYKFEMLRTLIKKLNNRMDPIMFDVSLISLFDKINFFSRDLSSIVIDFAKDMPRKKNINESISMMKGTISDLVKTSDVMRRSI